MTEDLVCDGCGAMLAVPDSLGRATCTSCGRVNTNLNPPSPPPPAGSPPVSTRVFSLPPGMTGTHGTAGRGRTLRSTIVAFVAVAATIAAIALVVAMSREARSQADGRAAATRYSLVGDDAIVLPGEGSAPAELVTLAYDNQGTGSKRILARVVVGQERAPIWSSVALPSDVYSVLMVTSGDDVFVSLGDQVWNLSLRSGERRWAATLPDEVSAGCRSCFQLVDGHLLVLGRDATLSEFDAASAEPRWSRRLTSPGGRFLLAGGKVVVVDDSPADASSQLLLLEPADGTVIHTTDPTCPAGPDSEPEGLSTSDAVEAVPGSADVVVALGRGSGCLLRIDPASGAVRWSAALNENDRAIDDQTLVMGQHLVYTSPSSPPGHVDLETGATVVLEAVPDLEIHPRTVIDGVLLAETVTTRGSSRPGLGAWDTATGKRLWTSAVPGGAGPVDVDGGSKTLFDGAPASLLVSGGAVPRLVTFDGEARSVIVQTIDPRTGNLGEAATRPYRTRFSAGTDSLTILHADPDRLVVGLASMVQSIPLPDGPLAVWPEPA